MPGDDVFPRRRPHHRHHAVRRPDGRGEQLRLARGAVVVDTGLDKTADVVQVVLLAVVASILAPAVAGFAHLRIGIDVAVGVTRRRRADPVDVAVDPRLERGVGLLRHQVGRATNEFVDQPVVPRRAAVRGVEFIAGDVVEIPEGAIPLELVQTVFDRHRPPGLQLRRPERVVDRHAVRRDRNGPYRRGVGRE